LTPITRITPNSCGSVDIPVYEIGVVMACLREGVGHAGATRNDGGVVTKVNAEEQVEWLSHGLTVWTNPWVHHVSELLPSGYHSYLRLFHPFVPWTSKKADPIPEGQSLTWESVADEAGVSFHGELGWQSLEPVIPILPDGGRRYATYEGQIERSTANKLMAVLAASGPAQRVYFVYSHPGCLIATPNHEPLAFLGESTDFEAVIDAAAPAYGPTYIWPEDRRWVVATDYDLLSTYIACDARACEALMAESGLETLPVSLNTRIDKGSDQLNGTGYPEDYVPE
jgi:hypothetical protein